MTTLTKSQMAEVIVQVMLRTDKTADEFAGGSLKQYKREMRGSRRAVISRYNMAMNVRRQLEEADNG